MKCPSCSRIKGIRVIRDLVYECPECGCVFGSCYLGESYNYVLPYWSKSDVPEENIRPYDLTCIGSEGITRRHGWFDPETKRIVQTG